MSSENVELVRDLYRRINLDQRWPDEMLDDEIEWVNPPDAVEPGTRRGREEFHAAADRVTDVYEGELLPEEFIDAGEDDVVVLLTFVIEGRGSGVKRNQPQGHVWTVHNGKAIRFRWFNDPAQALEAGGVER